MQAHMHRPKCTLSPSHTHTRTQIHMRGGQIESVAGRKGREREAHIYEAEGMNKGNREGKSLREKQKRSSAMAHYVYNEAGNACLTVSPSFCWRSFINYTRDMWAQTDSRLVEENRSPVHTRGDPVRPAST
ncbi:hypothetical protein GJAV_G00147380 [Gymnothorax javanicus]|nr:hypothetical protein GJAV_G00147380 [Gymnothorax javanicus]